MTEIFIGKKRCAFVTTCCLLIVIAFPRLIGHAQDGLSSLPEKFQDTDSDRFDMLVRDDFFAGMMGDKARLDRGMKTCEQLLATNPKHAEALVWHGGGLITRASQAFRIGNSATGEKLWTQGIDEMNRAVTLEPTNIGVRIGRAATLIGLAQSGWDPGNSQAHTLLESAVMDYEQVYESQKPKFTEMRIHSRGELLFGLASGWSILGNQSKATEYLNLIVEECERTPYESEARRWLKKNPPFVVQHDCIGCHVSAN